MDTTMIKQYDRIRLKDGRTATVVEIMDFIVDIDLEGDWDTISIHAEDIEEISE